MAPGKRQRGHDCQGHFAIVSAARVSRSRTRCHLRHGLAVGVKLAVNDIEWSGQFRDGIKVALIRGGRLEPEKSLQRKRRILQRFEPIVGVRQKPRLEPGCNVRFLCLLTKATQL